MRFSKVVGFELFVVVLAVVVVCGLWAVWVGLRLIRTGPYMTNQFWVPENAQVVSYDDIPFKLAGPCTLLQLEEFNQRFAGHRVYHHSWNKTFRLIAVAMDPKDRLPTLFCADQEVALPNGLRKEDLAELKFKVEEGGKCEEGTSCRVTVMVYSVYSFLYWVRSKV